MAANEPPSYERPTILFLFGVIALLIVGPMPVPGGIDSVVGVLNVATAVALVSALYWAADVHEDRKRAAAVDRGRERLRQIAAMFEETKREQED